jgi:hypothetical protein
MLDLQEGTLLNTLQGAHFETLHCCAWNDRQQVRPISHLICSARQHTLCLRQHTALTDSWKSPTVERTAYHSHSSPLLVNFFCEQRHIVMHFWPDMGNNLSFSLLERCVAHKVWPRCEILRVQRIAADIVGKSSASLC